MPNKFVIHCLGPVYGKDTPHDTLLANCYINAINICEAKQIESIALPAISTGAFGYPLDEAAEVALKAIIGEMMSIRSLRRIRLVLFSDKDLHQHKKTLKRL